MQVADLHAILKGRGFKADPYLWGVRGRRYIHGITSIIVFEQGRGRWLAEVTEGDCIHPTVPIAKLRLDKIGTPRNK